VVDERGRVKASPAARKMAAERGIDLHSVATGSGPKGRILSTDLDGTLPDVTEVTRKKLAGMRKAIAKNLLASKQNIPHFYMTQTIDAGPMMAYYRAKKAETGCSLNDVLLQNLSICLREFPGFRTRLEGDELVTYPTANIGIAVGMDDGLVVPVAIGADRMSLEGLSNETTRLIESARGGKIDNMGQGVMTVSNLGMFGIEDFSAIINPPEASILAVSAIREEVIVKDGAMRPGRVMKMTLSCDHRVIDGLLAARFMSRLKELLEGLE
jgi:pyruvate dehydrogenase E2 component (dihydrolipoamide acetyltransferase)